MTLRGRAAWALVTIICIVLLCAPALWNGFPLLQYDTGGYLARWYEGYLVPSRAVVYGLILNAGSPLDFWPVVIVQSALTVWVLAVTLRVHGLARPLNLFIVTAALAVASTLPWLTAILITDIFCGLGVLALYLIMIRRDRLIRGERTGLALIVAVAGATHSATLAVLVALLAFAALVWLTGRARFPATRLRSGAFAIALGAALTLIANGIVAKRMAWTPGGFALSFGRMLQDGIVSKYLDEHCPDPRFRLCAVKDQLPRDADEWFWGSAMFDRMGRFAGLGKEMEAIALESLAAYPVLQLRTAVIAGARQLIDVRTGEGVLNSIWHTYGIIERYTPWAAPAMRAARQQRNGIDFTMLNWLHWPAALLAMALLPLLALRQRNELRDFSVSVMATVLANAAVCGVLSNPHDRYGARVAWLAVLAVVIAALEFAQQRTRHLGAGEKPA